jgi:hypothetical protein
MVHTILLGKVSTVTKNFVPPKDIAYTPDQAFSAVCQKDGETFPITACATRATAEAGVTCNVPCLQP